MYPGECGCHLAAHWGGSTVDTDRNLDDDGDGIPNCADQCPGQNDLIDNDGNGLPDACEKVLHTYQTSFGATPLAQWVSNEMNGIPSSDGRIHVFQIPEIFGTGATSGNPIPASYLGGRLDFDHPNAQIRLEPQSPDGMIWLDAEGEHQHIFFRGNNLEVNRIGFLRGSATEMPYTYKKGGSVLIEQPDPYWKSTAVFRACWFANNEVYCEPVPLGNNYALGGAIYSTGRKLELLECVFEGNQALPRTGNGNAKGIGGAVSVEQADWLEGQTENALIIRGCYFGDNKADRGGAVHCYKRPMEVFDSSFERNTALTRGGAPLLELRKQDGSPQK